MDRYIVTYIPKSAVMAVEAKHPEEIRSGGYSVWDFVQPEDLEVSCAKPTEAAALAHAAKVMPLDDSGEVHVAHDVWIGSPRDGYWETERTGHIGEGESEFTWYANA